MTIIIVTIIIVVVIIVIIVIILLNIILLIINIIIIVIAIAVLVVLNICLCTWLPQGLSESNYPFGDWNATEGPWPAFEWCALLGFIGGVQGCRVKGLRSCRGGGSLEVL